MEDFFKGILVFIGVIILIFILSFPAAWLTMILWNACMPVMFGLLKITFWTAWCFFMLCMLLFKSSSVSTK